MAELPDDLFDDLEDDEEKEKQAGDEKDLQDSAETIVGVKEVEDNTNDEVEITQDEVNSDQIKEDVDQVDVVPDHEVDTDEAEAALEGQLEILGISDNGQQEEVCLDKNDGDNNISDDSSSILKEECGKVDEDFKNEMEEQKDDKDKDIVPGCVRGRWQEISTEGDSSWDSTSSQVLRSSLIMQ